MLSGDTLRETAAELLRHETRPDLCKRLTSLAKDVEMEGSEEEKNRFLAPLDKVEPLVEEFDAPRSGEATPEGEHDKQRSGRPHSEDSA